MRKILSFTLLLLLPFLFFFVSKEIYWVCHVLILLVIFLEKNKLNKNKLYLFLLLVIPLSWASFFSFHDHLYAIIQALFYLITPFLLTFLGMKISRIANQQLVFKYIIYSGTIGSLIYIGIAFYFFGFQSFIDPYAVREFFFWGSVASIIAIFLVLYSEKFEIVLIRNKISKYFIVGVNLLALYFTASRTYSFIFLIFWVIFLYNANKKKLFLILVFFAVFSSFFLTLFSDNLLVKRFASSATEIKVESYETQEEITTNYRGFETAMALLTYISGTNLNLIFGHGLGKRVDLGTEMVLGDFTGSEIPVLHNGYLYILIKEGLLGLFFYFTFFIKLFKLRSHVKDFALFNMIITGSIISILFSNFVVGTFFSMEMCVLWIIFGIYIGYVEMQEKKQTIL